MGNEKSSVVIKVSGVPKKMIDTIDNVATNLGHSTRSDYIKTLIRNDIRNQPESMKIKDE